jgi:hypothetical protein
MEPADDIYDNIRDVINNIPDNYQILEEIIDIDVQKDYFEKSKEISIDPESDLLEEMIGNLYNEEITLEDRKNLLQKLALFDSVEAYRAIEKYVRQPHPELKEWSILALQQSKMVLHCSLLDEQQVFISTGLGGKNDKLRYLLIFPYNGDNIQISNVQRNSLSKELQYFLTNNEGELESTSFEEKYATAMILLPLKAPLSDIIKEILTECNQLGDFLSHNAMITNMKKFSHDEIIQIISQQDEE